MCSQVQICTSKVIKEKGKYLKFINKILNNHFNSLAVYIATCICKKLIQLSQLSPLSECCIFFLYFLYLLKCQNSSHQAAYTYSVITRYICPGFTSVGLKPCKWGLFGVHYHNLCYKQQQIRDWDISVSFAHVKYASFTSKNILFTYYLI